jgi:predicted RNase H-like nuclease (RuvC/YqgF family)
MADSKITQTPDIPSLNEPGELSVSEPPKAENVPQKFWNGALKLVKGENTAKLIEDFTAEMTLVAEGLCEDQTKLRREVDRMITDEDRHIQKVESKVDLVEKTLDDEKNAFDQTITELRNRIASLEKKAGKESSRNKNGRSIIRDMTWLVGIASGAWVIVTIIQKFF